MIYGGIKVSWRMEESASHVKFWLSLTQVDWTGYGDSLDKLFTRNPLIRISTRTYLHTRLSRNNLYKSKRRVWGIVLCQYLEISLCLPWGKIV